jgi:hypothetical protein
VIVIAEPSTTLTSYLLAVLLGVVSARLTDRGASRSRALWAVAFALAAVSAFGAATERGFRPGLDVFSRALLRQCAYLGVTVAGGLLVAGLVLQVEKGRSRRYALLGVAVLMALELLAVAHSFATRDAIWVGAVNLALLLVLAARHARADGRLMKWLLGAVLVAGAGLAAQTAGIALHPSFNESDLALVLLCGALWPFYRAALLLEG